MALGCWYRKAIELAREVGLVCVMLEATVAGSGGRSSAVRKLRTGPLMLFCPKESTASTRNSYSVLKWSPTMLRVVLSPGTLASRALFPKIRYSLSPISAVAAVQARVILVDLILDAERDAPVWKMG